MDDALNKIRGDERTVLPKKWEPLLNNLGHVYRKLQKYDKAIECHMKVNYATWRKSLKAKNNFRRCC